MPVHGLPPTLQSAWYGLAPLSFFDAARRRYGDVFTVRVMGMTWTVLADPEAVRDVFNGDPAALFSGEANLPLRPLIGTRNLLLLDGAQHLRRRKLLLAPFHGARMQAYRPLVERAARRELDAWPVGRPQGALAHMQAITFEVILRAVFGLGDADQLGPLSERLRVVLDWVQSPRAIVRFALHGPEGLIDHAPFQRMVGAVDEEVFGEIARRRADPGLASREDILSLLLLARDEDGRGLEDRDVRDELLTLLTAGHETTAAMLAWAVHFLARDPAAQERLAAGTPGFVDAVVQETLRLRPPIALVARVLKTPVKLGANTLPAGTIVAPSPLLIHRDPAIHPDPASFRPDRFTGTRPPAYGWIPFGGGVRRCIGAAFAQLEGRVVLEEIFTRFRARPPRQRREPVGRRGIVLVPLRGGRIVLEPR
ncbi:cytochrome P450 [Solirubrobacter soli]|uniref:cytochrome P450 n=1 Tax=Solirubrobacter soli TaxID=363832 RepID=UPI0005631144|nr:cytochrome P450 [Solirubrobacter soli]